MSLYFETSPKHCGSKHSHGTRRLGRRLLCASSSCLVSVALAALLVYLILHPTKPSFHLREAELYQLSLASPGGRFLNSTLQFTLVATNPNTHVGIYYGPLLAYAAYRGQRITTAAEIPPFYQGHQDSNLLSASLRGTSLPVAASLGYEVGRDQTAGRMVLELRLDGRLRWKVGTWVSPQYHVDVDCTAVMVFGPGGSVGSMTGTQCSTSV